MSRAAVAIAAVLAGMLAAPACADDGALLRVLTLRDHNTRVVILGTTMLGIASGVIGSYMLLRRRALVADALSHATLPGIAIAFLVMNAAGGTGKWLPGLLLGAALAGIAGVGAIMLVRSFTRVREDAALGIVLSVSFGLGLVLLGVIQKLPTGTQAGLESFIYGKTASMLTADALLIGGTAIAVLLCCTFLAKEFALLSFDADFARAQGWPVAVLDLAMMALVTVVTVIGLQAVGLILVIALLIIPPAAARFWTHHLRWTIVFAAAFGAASGLLGAAASAVVPKLPAGAIIVTVAACLFVLSMLLGPARGVMAARLRHARMTRGVARQHLLRAMYEWLESSGTLAAPAGASTGATGIDGGSGPLPEMPYEALLARRSWSPAQLGRALRRAEHDGLVTPAIGRSARRLTREGLHEAARVARHHRLWELYLITHADIAPSHVDRDADAIEHVLGSQMVRDLEAKLAARARTVPASPHALEDGA